VGAQPKRNNCHCHCDTFDFHTPGLLAISMPVTGEFGALEGKALEMGNIPLRRGLNSQSHCIAFCTIALSFAITVEPLRVAQASKLLLFSAGLTEGKNVCYGYAKDSVTSWLGRMPQDNCSYGTTSNASPGAPLMVIAIVFKSRKRGSANDSNQSGGGCATCAVFERQRRYPGLVATTRREERDP
jgi:hypothetical protein